MKNMKKFITLCGFLILGSIACGDADVVKAEAINEQTTDMSGYTITIPSEISFSTDTTNFDISAGLDKSTQIIISASSQNGFNLTNGDDTIPYSISDNLITLSNSRPDMSNTVSQSLNIFIDKSKSPMYGGDYKDTLTFNIQEKQLYTLNVNGLLDGNTVSWLNGYGTFGIKINGRAISNLADFYQSQAEGTTYEIFNIKSTDGKHYIGDTIIKGTFDSPYQEINLKFDTNKLTLNYHTDGAQTWHNFDNITYDVSGKDIAYTSVHLYGNSYDAKFGLGDVSRLKKDGYTAKSHVWSIGKNGNKEIRDNIGLAKSQDVADYCGVLDEFKKNDTTIDLYPIWIPNTYTLTYDLNGGSFNASTTQLFKYGSGDAISSEIPVKDGYSFTGWKWGDVTMHSGDKIPLGWGNFTLTAQWEKASYSTGTVLNIEGNDYIVMGQTEDGNYRLISGTSIGNIQFQPNVDANGNYKVGTYEIPDEKRPDGQNSNTYEGSYIDNYLENTWYKQLPDKLQKAIQTTNIKQSVYNITSSNPKWRWFDPNGGSNGDWYYNEGTTENPKWVIYHKANIPDDAQSAYPLNYWEQSEKGYNNSTYNTISRHVFLPSVEEVSNLVDLNNANKVYNFLKGTNNSLYHMWFRDSNSSSPRYALGLNYGIRSMNDDHVTDAWLGVRPSFVIDLSKIDYTVTGIVNYK